MKIRDSLIIAALLLTSASLADLAHAEKSEKWGGIPVEQWQTPAPSDYPEAAAVVLFDNGGLLVGLETIQFSRQVRIKVFDRLRAEAATKVEFELRDGDILADFNAQTIKCVMQKGKRKVIKTDVSREEVFKKDIGDKNKLVTFTFPAVEDSCLLDYKYTIRHRRYQLLDPWYFQSNLFTLESQFSVTLVGGFTYNTVLTGVPDKYKQPVKDSTVINSGTYTWTVRDLFPVEHEPFMPAENSYRASITCQLVAYRDPYQKVDFIEDWRTLGQTVEKGILEKFRSKKGKLEQTAQSVIEGLSAATDKAKRLYEFVRDEIQTNENETGYLSDKSDLGKMLENKVGTIDEKNILLVELLKSIGLKAFPLMIGTRDFAQFNPKIYQLRSLNRFLCFVTIDGKDIVLDAADHWVPFPYLPVYDLVEGGLLLDADSSRIISLEHPKRSSAVQTASKIKLRGDGSAICSTHVTLSGYSIPGHRDLLQEKPKNDDIRESLFHGSAMPFELMSHVCGKAIVEDSIAIDFVFSFPNLATVDDSLLSLTPSLYMPKDNPFTDERRFSPIDFGYTFAVIDAIDLEFDDGVTVVTFPEDVNIKIIGISFTRTTFAADNAARIASQMIVSNPVFSVGQYAIVRDFFIRREASVSETMALKTR